MKPAFGTNPFAQRLLEEAKSKKDCKKSPVIPTPGTVSGEETELDETKGLAKVGHKLFGKQIAAYRAWKHDAQGLASVQDTHMHPKFSNYERRDIVDAKVHDFRASDRYKRIAQSKKPFTKEETDILDEWAGVHRAAKGHAKKLGNDSVLVVVPKPKGSKNPAAGKVKRIRRAELDRYLKAGYVRAEETDLEEQNLTMTVPLFIRFMEFARETAKDDLILHKVADRAVTAQEDTNVLCSNDYHKIVKEAVEIKKEK